MSHVLIRQRVNKRFSPWMPNWIQSAVVVPGAAGNLDKREQWPNNVTLRFLKGSWLTRLWISTSTSQEPVRGSLWFGLTVEIQRSFSRKGPGAEPALKLPSWWKRGFCYQSSSRFLSNNPEFNRQIVSAVVCRFVLLKTTLLLIHSNWNRVSKRHKAVEFLKIYFQNCERHKRKSFQLHWVTLKEKPQDKVSQSKTIPRERGGNYDNVVGEPGLCVGWCLCLRWFCLCRVQPEATFSW